MNSDIFASIAYIVGVIISGEEGSVGVVDYSLGGKKTIFGEANNQTVDVYDYDQRCHIAGDKEGNRYNLTHQGYNCDILIEINDNQFNGQESCNSSVFDGEVDGYWVWLYADKTYQYQLI